MTERFIFEFSAETADCISRASGEGIFTTWSPERCMGSIIDLSRGVALYCTCTAALLSLWCLSTMLTLPCYFHRTFNNYTGGQSVSFVLLWQPSECIDLFVIELYFCLIIGK